MDEVVKFLLKALPKVGEALVPAARDYFAERGWPVPPSLDAWLSVDARIDAKLAAMRRGEKP